MARAARGCADAAGRRRAGVRRARPARRRRTAAGCCCWSGRATTAATRCTPARLLARRGCAVEAWLLADGVHEGGLAALRGAGGRVGRAARRRRRGAPDVVVDGIVGIGGRPGLRPERGGRARPASTGVPVVAVDVPSGVDVDTGELDGPHVTADAHRHVRHPQGRATSSTRRQPPAGSSTSSTSASTCPTPPVEALQPDDVAGCCRGPPRDAPQVHPRRRRRPRRLGHLPRRRRCSASPAPPAGSAGMVRYVGPRGRRPCVRRAHPEVVGEGRVQAWVVGSGGGDATRATSSRPRSPTASRSSSTPTRCGTSTDPLGVPAVLTPARRRAGRDARRRARRRRGRGRSHHARAAAARVRRRGRCSRAATRSSPTPTAGSGSPPPARRGWPPPAPATCSAG